MNVRNGGHIIDGGVYNFGAHSPGSNTDVVFTIENTGTENLTLTTPLALGGADAGQFSIQAQPTSPVAPSGTTTFTVRFSPTSAGNKTATLAIANNDSDENPYNLTLNGSGTSLGDVSGNGSIDLLDVRLCLQIAQGYLTPTAAQRQAADVDGDGDVDETDAQILSEYIIGMRSTLP